MTSLYWVLPSLHATHVLKHLSSYMSPLVSLTHGLMSWVILRFGALLIRSANIYYQIQSATVMVLCIFATTGSRTYTGLVLNVRFITDYYWYNVTISKHDAY